MASKAGADAPMGAPWAFLTAGGPKGGKIVGEKGQDRVTHRRNDLRENHSVFAPVLVRQVKIEGPAIYTVSRVSFASTVLSPLPNFAGVPGTSPVHTSKTYP